MTSAPLTLPALHDLALRWCPPDARWGYLLDGWDYWGPAHELAHAILSRPEERTVSDYGLCEAAACRCPGERCHVVELAAQRISGHLLRTVGRQDLAEDDIWSTDGYTEIATPANDRASWHLLRAEHLWPLPRTIAGLERLLRRRMT